MKRIIIFFLFLLGANSFFFLSVTNAAEQSVDPQIGFEQLQQPFSEFLQQASRINISSSTNDQSIQISIPQVREVTNYWDQANEWTKEHTGLDVLNILKMVGQIFIFIMHLAIQAMQFAIQTIQWLLSLIPGNTQGV